MEKVILILALTLGALGYSQVNYEMGMQKAFELWENGNNSEAAAQFERIASAEKNNWLPSYYVALINTTTAFGTNDFNEKEQLLSNAQQALDKAMELDPNNAELLVMQAMIHTARIAADPITNGQKLSGSVMQLYGKASALAPDNPRVVLSKAQFEMGSAQFFGSDTAPICKQFERSLALFDTFKPESSFHPAWGRDQAEYAWKACK